ncbi:MAG: hypothetical protein ACT6T3_05775 [Agrobacterium sp.]|uniref:hypothetical protein n=1 Tax=Agrobacterium sp. TaxID=361 RepID=UPI0040343697
MTLERNPKQTKHDAETYGLRREEAAGARHGAGWWVSIRRRGHRIVRLFKDSIYGSGDAAYRQARACRDGHPACHSARHQSRTGRTSA